VTTTLPAAPSPSTTAVQRLRASMGAVRVSFTWLGVRRTLSPQQKLQAAESFGAERDYLSAGKKLLDTSHPAFKAVTTIRGRTVAYWRSLTLPYPEPGIRLIRQDDVAAFTAQLTAFRQELAAAVQELELHYAELKSAASRRLGTLFNLSDYPPALTGWFDMSWDFPSVEPPDYLRQLHPRLYQEEAARMTAHFEEAVQLAEQAFTEELSTLIAHLIERLAGSEDGKPKVFRDSAVGNLREFFERFRHLDIRSSPELDELVRQAQQVVGGARPQPLREDPPLRQRVATQLSRVQSALDGLLVDRPRRAILRRPR
jgi:hypothetical protein